MDNSPLLLIAEDDHKIAAVLCDYLQQQGARIECVDRGDQVEDAVRRLQPDLLLLDLMLPGRNGLDICRTVRSWSTLPIIMLTARVEEVDRLLGLELGADDYICKPFSPREVVARIRAVLRRTRPARLPAAGSDIVLNEAGWSALLNGHDLGLTAVEFQLLRVMVAQPGRIFTRDQLMDAMYRDERIVSDRTVDSHIKKLRRKISDVEPERELIWSVYGVGYKYEPA